MRSILSVVLAFVLSSCAASTPASGGSAAESGDAVAARLAAAVERGYTRREAESILAQYAADAVIVTRLSGQLDTAGFRAVLERDLATFGEVQVRVTVKQASEKGGEVTVALTIQMSGKRTDGRSLGRDEVGYYRLVKREEGWRIVQQSYRSDFGAASGHPTAHPAVPSAPLK